MALTLLIVEKLNFIIMHYSCLLIFGISDAETLSKNNKKFYLNDEYV